MPYRNNPSYKDQYYHVYNRGNNRGNIFFEDKNYHYFLSKVKVAFEDKIDLISYCLMPNHFHFLVMVKEDGVLEQAMQKISTGYTRAINQAYNRTGHLFQGRFKNKLIPSNEYLLHLSRYILRNPLRAGLVKKLEDWNYSSYLEMIHKNEAKFIKPQVIWDQFSNIEEIKKFIKEFDENQNYFVKDMLF
jgi:REP element-mobilizing transposase RayT